MERMRIAHWMVQGGKNTLLALVSLILTGLLLEGGLQLTSLRRQYLPPLEPQGYVRADTAIGYDIAPNVPPRRLSFTDGVYEVWSNEWGCFDIPFQQATSSIYLTGDSFTWGWVPLEKNWGKGIEALLHVRALTCGVNGYGTRQQLVKTSRHLAVLPQKPSLLIVGYLGANDVDDDVLFPHYSVYDGYRIPAQKRCSQALVFPYAETAPATCQIPPPSLKASQRVQIFLGARSVLYNVARQRLHIDQIVYRLKRVLTDPLRSVEGVASEAPAATTTVPGLVFKRHLESMQGFKLLAESENIPLLIVLIPSKTEVRTRLPDQDRPNERMRQWLEEAHIPYVDLLPSFQAQEKLPEGSLYWKRDGHWNERGNHLASLEVAKYITEHQLLPVMTNINNEYQDYRDN